MKKDLDSFQDYKKRLIVKLDNCMKEIKKVDEAKTDKSETYSLIKEVQKDNRSEQIKAQKTADNLLTLENYCEKYLPIATLKLLQKIMRPLYDEETLEKMKKHCNRFLIEMQQHILDDMGKGSLFDNIEKINDEMSNRLKLRMDMTKVACKFVLPLNSP